MKALFTIAQSFAERIHRFASMDDLATGLEGCARELGFRHFALLHHLDLHTAQRLTIRIDNYPTGFVEWFIEKRMFRIDPMLCASLYSNIGFAWDEVHRLIRIGPKHRTILDQARREGLAHGITIPANIPGEAHGSCSFACYKSVSLTDERKLAAQLVGSFAFQAARRIRYEGDYDKRQAVELTPRQRDCVQLVAQGKTDWEIGRILGLAEDSVTKVVNAARLRYDVANRTELVVAALFDGEISFNEVRHWQSGYGRVRFRPE